MSFTTTLMSDQVTQSVDYSNGYRMTVVGIKVNMSGRPTPPKPIASFKELEIGIHYRGKPICRKNANVPEWLEPIFAELEENLDGNVFRWVTRDVTKWVHEELKERAARSLLVRLGDFIVTRSKERRRA